MKPFFFGPAEAPLFGAYHAARSKKSKGARAVLICPPIGQEYIRTHWALRLVAGQLARKGIHVMRMDYAGLGDSAGRNSDVTCVSTWHQNIVAATDQLRELSGAEGVTLLGLRFGAALAWQVALEHPGIIHSVVSWEPVADGRSHLAELRQLHARMLDLNNAKMSTPNDGNWEELIGSLYSRSLVQQIEAYEPSWVKLIQPHLMLQSESSQLAFDQLESPWLRRDLKVDDTYTWDSLPELETAWLVPMTARNVVSNIEDLFARLEQFGLLSAAQPPSTVMLSPQSAGVNIGSTSTAGV